MTAIIIVPKSNGIDILTDTAAALSHRVDAPIACSLSKQNIFTAPFLGVAAVVGYPAPLDAFMRVLMTADSMEEIVPDLGQIWEMCMRETGFDKPCALFLAGFMDGKPRAVFVHNMAYPVPCYPNTRITPYRPCMLVQPYAEGGFEADFDLVHRFRNRCDEFDAERDGVACMDAMRNEDRRLIGGSIQHTWLCRDGVTSRTVHTWPDKIGDVVRKDGAKHSYIPIEQGAA